ncbi:MAG: PIN domain-containing protein [Patescibacteria group bacterium]
MIVLDTNIIIDHLRQSPNRQTYLKTLIKKFKEYNLAISIITIQEIYEGESTKERESEAKLLATISRLKILPYTFEVAQLAGEIARDLGKPIDLADAAIAATAIINGFQLFTLNKKHFEDIKGLEMIDL